ncbi:TonB-dependent receptor [Raineya sp.]|jgi:hypothetical protein
MNLKIFYAFSVLFIFPILLLAQKATLQGKVFDEYQKPLETAIVGIPSLGIGTNTNAQGFYSLQIPANQVLRIKVSYLGKSKDTTLQASENTTLEINFYLKVTEIEAISVLGRKKDSLQRLEASTFRLDAKRLEAMPSAFGDFNKILATLAGVVSNNELSSTYSVRGGSFDENLVYVNDILIYRPVLIRAGQQEGLSFINPNLAEEVSFSSGGWQAKYGDKLSSVLSVQYRKPTRNGGSLTLGILNNQAHVEGLSKNQKFTYLLGIRRKSSRYLLRTLPVKGEYLPQFIDVQGYFTYQLSKKWSAELLTSYAQNRYLVHPASQQSTFGTINRVLRLFVAFEGQETMNYDITQNALKLAFQNEKLKSSWILSQAFTAEKEYSEVEGGYRLCEINPNFGTQGFNECILTVGIGSEYLHLRNRFQAQIYALENRSVYDWRATQRTEAGFRLSHEIVDDVLQEYNFLDSSGFVRINYRNFANNFLASNRFAGFLQHQWDINSRQRLTAGLRVSYWSINREWVASPTLQYAVRSAKKDMIWKFAVGMYQQPPFYRELRSFEGNLNLALLSQKSLQLIAGNDWSFKGWGERTFRFTNEIYYKYLWDIVPYDVDNVRLRYYPTNDAFGYAYGWDMRISGELIKGTESWVSMSLMKTDENVAFDNKGFVRRPTDQRFTLGVYLEDYLPNNPTWRMNLNLVWGSGLPFNVPNNPNLRNVFQGKSFRRVDIGFSKFVDKVRFKGKTLFQSLWIGADILNLLAINNPVSYSWVSDLNGQRYAIPNALSARFLNLRVIVKW